MTLPDPVHVHQIDGSPWGPYACMGASAAMALDAYTRGAVRVGQAAIRAKQDDQQGGIGLDDVATAWKRGWGLTFTHGRRSWAAVRARLATGDGAVATFLYGALGAYRAPGSKFTGDHAMYLAGLAPVPGTGAPGVIVHDPLRTARAILPEAAVKASYTGGAGWGAGTYAGTSSAGAGAVGAPLGAFYRNGVPLVTYPRGSTSWTASAIMATLGPLDYFGSALDPAAGLAEDAARAIMRADEGRPWNEALHAEWARELGAAANVAGSGPLGLLGVAFPDVLAGVGDIGRQLLTLGFVLALVLLGLYLTVGGRETVVKITPAAVRAAL